MRDVLRILHALQVPVPVRLPAANDVRYRRAVLPQGHAAYLRRALCAANLLVRALLPRSRREWPPKRDSGGRADGCAHRAHRESPSLLMIVE